MSKSKELKSSINEEIEKYDTYIWRVNKSNDTIPPIHQKKEEAQTKLDMLKALPDDLIEELSPILISFQKTTEENIYPILDIMPNINLEQSSTDIYSSGSSTAFISVISKKIESRSEESNSQVWIDNVRGVINSYTGKVEKREHIPIRLNKLDPSLGQQFNIAVEDIEKCKAGTLEVNLGAMQLREVLSQVWGNIANFARENNTHNKFNTNNLEMRKECHRNIVVKLIFDEDYKRKKLFYSLNLLYDLYKDLSSSNFGKNILSKDLTKLNSIYNQWLLVLDDITGILFV